MSLNTPPVPPPWRRNANLYNVNLSGYLVPLKDDTQPVTFTLPTSDKFYLPCFSGRDHLERFFREVKASYHKIVHITDGLEFYASVKDQATVVVDPYVTTDGTTRFVQVAQSGDKLPPPPAEA